MIVMEEDMYDIVKYLTPCEVQYDFWNTLSIFPPPSLHVHLLQTFHMTIHWVQLSLQQQINLILVFQDKGEFI